VSVIGAPSAYARIEVEAAEKLAGERLADGVSAEEGLAQTRSFDSARACIKNIPSSDQAPNESAFDSQGRFARKYEAAKINATIAISHHSGGLHTRSPNHNPEQSATAAQNKGAGYELASQFLDAPPA
jgi:hypothetical protein